MEEARQALDQANVEKKRMANELAQAQAAVDAAMAEKRQAVEAADVALKRVDEERAKAQATEQKAK